MCACQLGLHFMVSCSVLNSLSVVGLTMQTRAASGWCPPASGQRKCHTSTLLLTVCRNNGDWAIEKILKNKCIALSFMCTVGSFTWFLMSSSLSPVLHGVMSSSSVVSMQNILRLLLMLSSHLLSWPPDTCWSACSFGLQDLCEFSILTTQPVHLNVMMQCNAMQLMIHSSLIHWCGSTLVLGCAYLPVVLVFVSYGRVDRTASRSATGQLIYWYIYQC